MALNAPTTPHLQPLPGITQTWFSLIRFRSPLLSESLLFSLPCGTEMFHFPQFPPHTLYIQARVTRHDSCWVPPFGHPRITGRLPPPQGLSQAPTSFIGSWCQGIHHVPLTACPQQRHNTTHTTAHNQHAPHHTSCHNTAGTTTTKTTQPTPQTQEGGMQHALQKLQYQPEQHTLAEYARVHYPDLKQQPHQPPPPTHSREQTKEGERNTNT